MDYSVIVGIAGIILAAATFFVGRTSSANTNGKQIGTLASDLGYVKSNTDEIKRRLDESDKRYTELMICQTELKRDMQTAYLRIDEIKAEINNLKDKG